MSQSRLGSLVEAWANIAVGFSINWCANMAILPLFGFDVTGRQAFGIGVLFTAISLARQYVLRRWFNGLKFGNAPKPAVALDSASMEPPAVDWSSVPVESLGREHA